MYKPPARGGGATSRFRSCTTTGWWQARRQADRRAGVLVVHALHEDVRFTPAMRADVEAEIESWARGWG
jgi:hypothetical protein